MKLTDLVSPQQFVGLMNSAIGDHDSERKQAIEETLPYFNALVDAGYLESNSIDHISNLMSTISIFQQCLNKQKVSA